jgi:hypothetical protein
VRNAVMPLIYEQENEQENLAMAERIFQQFDPENGAEMALEFKMYFYQIRQMNEEFAQAAIDFYGKKPEADWETLNQIAWSFYELVENKDQLKVALGWAEQSVAIERNYFNVDTLAALHYKLGNKKPAMKLAKEAIKLAKAAGEDPGGSEELLKNIKAM